MWLIILAFASTQFSDVPPTHTAYPAVQYLVENNIIKGNENNQFLPDTALTRAEALKISLLAGNINPLSEGNATTPFNDIPVDHWAVPFINYAVEHQVIKGYEDQTFRPNQVVSRAEGIKILFNAFQITPSASAEASYSDIKSDNWFFPYANYLAKAKLWPTIPPIFDQNKPLTRGEMAELAYALIIRNQALATPLIPIWAALLAILLWSISAYFSIDWWRRALPKKRTAQLFGAILTAPISSLLISLKALIPQITIYEHAASSEDSHLHPIKALLTPRKIGLEIYQYMVVKSLAIIKFCFVFFINYLLFHILTISYHSYFYRFTFNF